MRALHGNDAGRNRERPAAVFASAAEAAAARAAAGPRGVWLLSTPGAAAFPGARVVAAMVARGVRGRPGVPHAAVLDCGAAPGLALDALRGGWSRIVLDPGCPAFDGVVAAAAELGATVLPTRPRALDLAALDLRGPGGRAILVRWLAAPP